MATQELSPAGTDSEIESTLAADQFTSLSLSTTTSSSRLNQTRQELEKWQLHHTIQLLKLELSQKNVIIDSLKAEHQSKMEEVEEKLSEVECDKKLLQQRQIVLTKLHEEEKQDLKQQLSEARRSSLVKTTNSSFNESKFRENIESALQKTLLMEEKYQELIAQDLSSIDYCDLIQMRIYEVTRPFVNEGEWLREELNKLQSSLKEMERQSQSVSKKFTDQEYNITELQTQCDQLTLENARLVTQTKSHSFKSEHYDTIKSERDSFEKELDVLRRSLMEKELNERSIQEKREKMQDELISGRHSIALLKQDKEYLQKQVDELLVRCRESEERAESLQSKLSDVKQSKEELYKEFVTQRQEQKSNYETRLQQELESLRIKTNVEIEQLKIQTREMYERENRALLQAKEMAYSDRERAISKQTELEDKHELLLNEFRQLQVSSDGRISHLSSELQMKSFELERVRLLHVETRESLKKSETERQELREKLNTLSSESESVIKDLQSLVRELESKLKDRNERLEGYEKLEQELDDVVLQAANIDSEQDAERVLFSYGFGTSVPSSAKRRAQQSLQLARRVLKLERVNVSLRKQLESEGRDKCKLKEKALRLSRQFELLKQPQKYLVEAIKQRESQLEKCNNRNCTLESKNKELEKSLHQLSQEKNQLSSDLERLLSHHEELNLIKQMILSSRKNGRSLCGEMKKLPWQQKDIGGTSHECQPQPTIFTSRQPS